jgi:hypothetical protein
VWILAAAGRLLGGGWSPAARSAAKIHGFLLFSGGGGCHVHTRSPIRKHLSLLRDRSFQSR